MNIALTITRFAEKATAYILWRLRQLVAHLDPTPSAQDEAAPRVVNGQAAVKIGERTFQIASDDDYLAQIAGTFEPALIDLLTAATPDHATVFDIGANIGCTTLFFAQRAQRVVAFEPSPTTFALLSQNVTSARFDHVTLMNNGLGNANETTQITFDPHNRSGAFISSQTHTHGNLITEQITVRTLDSVVSELDVQQLDLIKIDVEGFELFVLEGGKNALAQFQPLVVLEMNHWCLNALQRMSIPDFIDQLLDQFPILLAVDDNGIRDLHDAQDRFDVMYYHINHQRFNNLVGAFDESQIRPIREHFPIWSGLQS